MISISFDLTTKPRMNLELLQVMGSIIVNFNKADGCENVVFKQDKMDKNHFCFRMDWENNVLLKSFLSSNEFDIFQGSMDVLCYDPTVKIISNDNSVLRTIKKNYKKELQKEFIN